MDRRSGKPSGSMTGRATLLPAIAILLFIATSCSSGGPADSVPSSAKPGNADSPEQVNRLWVLQAASVREKNPFIVALRVTGVAEDAPFLWSVTITDSNGSSVFQTEHDDREIDRFFGEQGFIGQCSSYQECKTKWYFDDLPKLAENAITVIDPSDEPIDEALRDTLTDLASEFLESRGLSAERRAAVIKEMLQLRAGRFERLYLPENPVKEGASFMYVPSVGYFVPYWRA